MSWGCVTNIISSSKKVLYSILIVVCCALFFEACTTIVKGQNAAERTTRIARSAKIAIIPFINNTETVRADQRAEAMLADLLHAYGADDIIVFPQKEDCDHFADCPSAYTIRNQAIKWALEQKAQYVLTGSINEWRYKVGLDGEPSVSMTLRLLLIPSEKTVWSAVGSKVGGSRSGLGGTAQELIMEMTSGLQWH